MNLLKGLTNNNFLHVFSPFYLKKQRIITRKRKKKIVCLRDPISPKKFKGKKSCSSFPLLFRMRSQPNHPSIPSQKFIHSQWFNERPRKRKEREREKLFFWQQLAWKKNEAFYFGRCWLGAKGVLELCRRKEKKHINGTLRKMLLCGWGGRNAIDQPKKRDSPGR